MRPEPEFPSRLHNAVNILFVEDDAAFAELVRSDLDRAPWAQLRLQWVDTLAGALERLAGGGFDLIITDLDMPDSRGLETVEALARASDRLVIVLTGDPAEGLREAAIARGAYDVVRKDRLDRVELERLLRLASMQAKTFHSLRESEERFRSLTEMSSDWLWEQDAELRYVPRAGGKGGLGGRNSRLDVGKRRWELDGIGGVSEAQWREHKETLAARKPFRDFEYRRTHDGVERWLSISGEPIFDAHGRFQGYRGIGRDITQHRLAEADKRRVDRMYAALSAANEAILRASSREALLEQACDIAVKTGEFLLGVVYLVEPGQAGLRRVAASGEAAKISDEARPSLDPAVPAGQGLIGLACRTGQPVVSNDYEADPRRRPDPVRHPYAVGSVAVFPLTADGELAGAIGLQHAERNAFSGELIQLLQRLADNISFALGNLRREERRLAAEAELQRFRLAMDLSADAITLVDAETLRFVDVNATTCEKSGYSREEVLALGPHDFAGSRAEDLRRAFGRLIVSGQTDTAVSSQRNKDGTVRPVEVHRRAVRSAGRWLIVSIVRDISERLQAEQQLRRAELEFRSIFENALEGMFRVDGQGRVVMANPALAAMLGFGSAEEMMRGVRNVAHQVYVDPDDRRRYFDLVRAQGTVTGFETRWRQRDGGIIRVSLSGRLMHDADTGASYHLGTAENVTERKQAEEALRESEARFRSLTDLSSDFYWKTDGQHRLLEFSHGSGYRRMVGGAIGKTRWEVPSTYPDAAGWARLKALMDAHQPFRDFEFARVSAEGEERHASITGEPVFGPDGSFAGYRGVGRDITARRQEERMVGLEHAVTRVLADSDDPEQAVRDVIRAICKADNWDGGRYFDLDEAAGLMRFRGSWTARSGAFERFIADSGKLGYARGEGLVGKAWHSGDIEWSDDPAGDPRVKYPELARQAGLKVSFSFPLHFEGRVCGVLSISSTVAHSPQGRFLKALAVIGSQIGQFLQRKQAEQALTEGEARFRQTFELAATGIAHVSLERIYLRVNRRLCEVLGYAEAELVGRSVREFSHPEDREVMDPGLARLRQGEVPFVRAEKRYLRKDGTVVWMELTVALARNAAGEPQYEISLYEDITERKASEDALRRFRAALDGSADMVLLVELGSLRLIDFNDTACTYLGYRREELLGAGPHVLLRDADEALLRKSYEALLAHPGRADSVVRTFRRKDGRTFEAEVLRRVIESPTGPILVINARDLTERNLAQQRQALQARNQEQLARFGESALGKRQSDDLVQDGVQTVHEALRADAVLYVEPGQGPRELVVRSAAGMPIPTPVTGSYAAADYIALALEHGELALAGEGAPALPFDWARGFSCAALAPVHGDDRVLGALCVLSRTPGAFGAEETKLLVTAASVLSAGLRRIDSEGRLAFLAQFDLLTGLPNRALLRDRFSQMIVHARRHDIPLGVLFIDLDDFKLVNDTLGHAGGDELLKEMARRLQSAVRPGDTVARISGDEFAVILADLARPDDAALVAQKAIDCLAAPMHIGDQEVFVTASIGIAAFPADGDDAEALLGAADAAMYRAKQSGRNTYEFFTADINQRSRARAQLGVELRRALERDEFVLAYQPKFDLRTGQPCAAEALLRWRHPERGLVAPGEFIPVLEETGLIVQVGEWVLRRACEDLVAWKAAGIRQVPIAVNLSARQFRLQDLDARIRGLIARAGIDPQLIELEITESQLMLDPEHAKRMMQSLYETGLRVAIDDFGTGYSSLSYLTRFPVSALKIDRSFVADVLKDQAAAAIVRAIIDMAHTLGFIVVAEGVETEAQAALLRSLGCEQAQGYYFARPMPEADLRALISSTVETRPGSSRFASRYP